MTEEEYRGLPFPSYSLLKNLPFSLQENNDEKKEGNALIFGTLVDKLITEPNYDYTKDFYVINQEINKDNDLIAYLIESDEKDFSKENLLALTYKLKMYGNFKDESRQKRIDSLRDQIDEISGIKLAKDEGKCIIDQDRLNKALIIHDTMLNHKYTSHIMINNETCENIMQLKIVFDICRVKCKAMLDFVQVDHLEKKIKPRDLKTGELGFYKSFYEHKYYYQAAMYTLAIQYWMQENDLDDYELQPFEFVYFNSKYPEKPHIYKIDFGMINDYISGFECKSGYIKGIEDLVLDYKWHIDNQIFDEDRSMYENNGVTTIYNEKRI